PRLPLRAADDSNSPASFALLDALYYAHARDGKRMLGLRQPARNRAGAFTLPRLPLRAADDSNSPASFALLDALYYAHARDGKRMLGLRRHTNKKRHRLFPPGRLARQYGGIVRPVSRSGRVGVGGRRDATQPLGNPRQTFAKRVASISSQKQRTRRRAL